MPHPPSEERRRMIDIVDARLAERLAEFEAQQRAGIERVCVLIKSGFPDGDPAEHRKAHEQMIAAHRERTEFYRELRKQLASKAVLGVVGVVLMALWYYAGHKIRGGGG